MRPWLQPNRLCIMVVVVGGVTHRFKSAFPKQEKVLHGTVRIGLGSSKPGMWQAQSRKDNDPGPCSVLHISNVL